MSEKIDILRKALQDIASFKMTPGMERGDLLEVRKLAYMALREECGIIEFPGLNKPVDILIGSPECKTIAQETRLEDREEGYVAVMDVRRKSRTWRGTFYPAPPNDQGCYNAKIKPGVEIRIFGHNKNHVKGPQNFNRTFKVGDMAEYDSFNLKYNGKIIGIGAKTVSILNSSKRKVMLDLYVFIDRNWDFDLDKSEKHNSEEMQYI